MVFVGIWNRIQGKDKAMRSLVAVPLFLTYVGGRYGWGMANNMLEGMLIVFTSLAIYCILCAFHSEHDQRWPIRSGYVAVAATATVLALLTKGPVGLFPLATIGISWLVYRKPRFLEAVLYTILLLAIIIGLFGLLRLNPEASAYMDRYLQNQLFASLSGQRGSDGGGIKALLTLLRLLFFPILICVLALASWAELVRKQHVSQRLGDLVGPLQTRNAAFFLLVGLSASLPLCISPRLYSFYFNTSVPYFAAALSCLCAPILSALFSRIPVIWTKWTVWLLWGGMIVTMVLVVLAAGREGPDKSFIAQSRTIGDQVCGADPKCGAHISACGSLLNDWQLIAYLQRQYRISIQPEAAALSEQSNDYVLADETCRGEVPTAYANVRPELSTYKLYKK